MEIIRLQRIQLEIVEELKRVCKKNNIKFFLIDGSALGAFYLNDFLPWDDDIDVGMYWEDYKKFLELSNTELNKKFLFKDLSIDKNFGCSFGQLIDTTNEIIQINNIYSRDKKGVFIDVHPFVECSNKKINRIFDYYIFKFYKICLLYKRKYINSNDFKYKIIKFICYFISEKFLTNKIMKRRNKKYSSGYAIKLHGRHKEDIIKTDYLKKLENIKFSGDLFPIMPDCKEKLKNIYGEFDINKNEINRHKYIFKE